MKKWKKWDYEKMKLYICFTADLKIYFIFRKALYYCIYLRRIFFWWMSLTLQGCQMSATLKNHEIFNYVYSFTPMLMKFLHNTLVISPKETPTLEFLFFFIFRKLWAFKISKPHNFRKITTLQILTWGFLWDLWQEYCVKISSTSE